MNLDFFLEIEKKYNLIQDSLDGFAYWTYFRYHLEWKIAASKNSYGEAHIQPHNSLIRQVKLKINMLKNAFLSRKVPRGNHDMLILNHERRIWEDGYYKCIYTDQIASLYPNSVVLERPYCQQHFRPIKTKNIVYTDYIEVKASIHYIYNKIIHNKKMGQIRAEINKRISAPIYEICQDYGVEYSINSILEEMVVGYYVYQTKKKELGKILDRIQPKLILEVVGYNIDCMIMNELAVARNIPTVELQHGMIGTEHISYNYPNNISVKQFPKYFFSFSRFWLETAQFPISNEQCKEVGFPHLEERAAIAKKNAKKKVPEKIIFISQGPIGKILAKIAVELNSLIDKEKYAIIYKLHPGEYADWKERYQELVISGIEVIDSNHIDLYDLFAASTYQIGAYGSTATFEGLYFNLKTYILREKAATELKLLCEKGYAEFFDTAVELYRLIQRNTESKKEIIRFWKENAFENMKREINELLEKDGHC